MSTTKDTAIMEIELKEVTLEEPLPRRMPRTSKRTQHKDRSSDDGRSTINPRGIKVGFRVNTCNKSTTEVVKELYEINPIKEMELKAPSPRKSKQTQHEDRSSDKGKGRVVAVFTI